MANHMFVAEIKELERKLNDATRYVDGSSDGNN